MLWNVRHTGSPQSVDGITDEEIGEGLLSGQWEPTDEVRAENESVWRSLETHPHFIPATQALEDAVPPRREEETHLDMNPLIDVSLVLLVFFILTATYATLRRTVELPPEPPPERRQALGGCLR